MFPGCQKEGGPFRSTSIDRAVRGIQVDSPMVPSPSISVMSLFPFPFSLP